MEFLNFHVSKYEWPKKVAFNEVSVEKKKIGKLFI